MWTYPRNFRMTAAFFPSTKALSFVCLARDLVNSTNNFFNKWKFRQSLCYCWNEMMFTNSLNGTNNLPLGDLIDQINVIDSFDFILVTLMNRVHAQVAWLPISKGFATLAN